MKEALPTSNHFGAMGDALPKNTMYSEMNSTIIIILITLAVAEQAAFHFMLPYPYRFGFTLKSLTTNNTDFDALARHVPKYGAFSRIFPEKREIRIRSKNWPGTFAPYLAAYTMATDENGTRIKARASACLMLLPAAYALDTFTSDTPYISLLLAIVVFAVIYVALAKGAKALAEYARTLEEVP